MIHLYDISHFRAPFKNVVSLSGLGSDVRLSVNPAGSKLTKLTNLKSGLRQAQTKEKLIAALTGATAGKTTMNTATTTAVPDTVTVTVANEVGYREFRPEAVAPIGQALAAYVVVVEGNDDAVSIHPIAAGDPRESALSWVNRKLNEGKAIVAGVYGNIDAFPATMLSMTETSKHILYAIPNTNEAKSEAAPSGGTLSAVLFTPATSAGNGVSPVVAKASTSWSLGKIALVGGAAVLGVGLLAAIAKKRG